MADCGGLLVIGLFLAALHAFFLQSAYSIGGRSEHPVIRNSIWEKNSVLKESSSRKLKGITANIGKPRLQVSQNANQGKGEDHFTKVQDAINAVPENNQNPVEIIVQPGIYREKVTIPANKPFITLSGLDAQNTVITWNDSAKSSNGTVYSATVTVYASDFTARNITIQNSYGSGNLKRHNQAVALSISGDRCAFFDCRFLAYQDTVLDNSGKHYFQNCYIEGAVDVICGSGKSIYKNCELHAIAIHYGAFTAQQRSSPSEDSGFVFLHCTLTGKGLMYLGRAWGRYSTVLFADTYMDNIIVPQGWDNWKDPAREKTVYVGQYQCDGPGAAESQRVAWSHAFTDPMQVAAFLNISYIDGGNWIT
eukprot:PITA_08082